MKYGEQLLLSHASNHPYQHHFLCKAWATVSDSQYIFSTIEDGLGQQRQWSPSKFTTSNPHGSLPLSQYRSEWSSDQLGVLTHRPHWTAGKCRCIYPHRDHEGVRPTQSLVTVILAWSPRDYVGMTHLCDVRYRMDWCKLFKMFVLENNWHCPPGWVQHMSQCWTSSLQPWNKIRVAEYSVCTFYPYLIFNVNTQESGHGTFSIWQAKVHHAMMISAYQRSAESNFESLYNEVSNKKNGKAQSRFTKYCRWRTGSTVSNPIILKCFLPTETVLGIRGLWADSQVSAQLQFSMTHADVAFMKLCAHTGKLQETDKFSPKYWSFEQYRATLVQDSIQESKQDVPMSLGPH